MFLHCLLSIVMLSIIIVIAVDTYRDACIVCVCNSVDDIKSKLSTGETMRCRTMQEGFALETDFLAEVSNGCFGIKDS
jgi:hypothetical protein